MKISYNWLKEIYPSTLTAEEMAVLLTGCGLEVEGIEEFESVKGGLKGLVVGQVKTCIKHPDADKLSLTTVDLGDGIDHQIVCGAPNVAAGQKVIVATPGTKIFPLEGEPFVIKQAKIRGQASNGMICAEDEIGLGKSHEGVIVLPADTKIGTPAAEYFKISSDKIFEIALTPNRADAASHIGVARDLSSVVRTQKLMNGHDEIAILNIPPAKDTHPAASNKIEVTVEDYNACPRYTGITVSEVKVAESPSWLKNRLLSIGVKPINNIVDITNYILHECGQPLHAFDVDEIKGKKIVVRHAKKGEKFTTLDKVERTLNEEDLMICDESSPMCIAGVFGGINSGISEKTTSVFIESACFNPSSIRKSSKRHGLKTDASFRFERGTDIDNTVYAMQRAANLMCEIAGGKISSEMTDLYPSPQKNTVVDLSYSHLDQFSGISIDRKIIRTILVSLGIKIIHEKDEKLQLEIPHFKVDVKRPADVVEEILRVYGYDHIPVPDKINSSLPTVKSFDREELQNKIANYLSSNGFNEILTNSLTKAEYGTLPSWDENSLVRIMNPLSQELSVMRQSLLFNALETLEYNSNRKQNNLRLFEFGKTYWKKENGYGENYSLSVLMCGNREDVSWKAKESPVDFYLLKSFVSNIISLCGIHDSVEEVISDPQYSESLSFRKGKESIVSVGKIERSILKKFDIGFDVYYAEFNWDAVVKYCQKKAIKYVEVSKFPPVKRDLSMLISNDITYSQLEKIAYNAERKLLKDIRLFDIYEGEKIESGKKSCALSFTLQDEEQTLTDSQITKTMDRLMNAFEKEAGAVIRKN